MTFQPWQYFRRKLDDSGLFPTSSLGRFTLYLLVVDLLLYVLQKVLWLAAPQKSAAGVLGGWVALLTFGVIVLGAVVGFRWFRRTVMWRLRNRLIVTYIFIGVIPLVLVLSMAIIAGYLFAGQFATFLVTTDLQSELKSLEAANSTMGAELANILRRRGARSPGGIPAVQGFRPGDPRLDRSEILAWYRGETMELHRAGGAANQPPVARPDWLKDQFRGIVLDNGALHLRVLTTVPVGDENVAILTSIPLDKELLQRIAGQTGEITIYLTRTIRMGSRQDAGGRPMAEFSVEPEGRPAAPVNRMQSVSGGSVPWPSHRLDREGTFATPFPVVDWRNGSSATTILQVSTRPSQLYAKLFVTMVEFGSVIQGVLIGIAIVFAIIELAALFVGIGLTRTMTRSVAELYQATEDVNRGNLKHRIEVKSRDQLAALETSFNSMTESLEKLIAEQKEKQRLENELIIAQEVQTQLFPKEVSDLETLEVHGLCRPARTVSGDYYDFLPLGPDKLGLAVGDISGKGISAALLMATVHSAVRAYEFGRLPALVAAGYDAGSARGFDAASKSGEDDFSPAHVLTLLNRQLYHTTPLEKYATLFLGVYDGKTRTLRYSNAGHLPPILIGDDGSLRRLDTQGLVIGLFDGQSYEERTIELRPRDIFLAFSDGITEPENEFGEFGEARLVKIVRENRHLPLARVCELVTAAVSDWIGPNEQPDDVTLVLARAR